MNIQIEKIPTYSLKVNLYEEDTSILLEGADYLITGGGKEQGETYTTSETGSFVIDDLYAYIDGKKTEIIAVNDLIQGIFVPQGEHKILFAYEPLSLLIGLSISIVTFLIMILVLYRKRGM